ncbi:MAG: HD domain-containing protein [Pseudomonadota bacterium]
MVTQARHFPAPTDDGFEADAWLRVAAERARGITVDVLRAPMALIQGRAKPDELEFALQLAELALALELDVDAVAAALCYRPARVEQLSFVDCATVLSTDAAKLLQLLLRMAQVQLLKLQSSKLQTAVDSDQVQNVQHMVTALIDDPRVAVLKLAERVVALRRAKSATRERQLRIAAESQRIFAPLAGRLGIWHLKWELEDLALRYLDPLAYRTIAAQLDGRRSERAQAVEQVAQLLEGFLKDSGIEAQVYGRAKHIFSIWRKMQAKALSFDQVYDVRAVRVLVSDLAQCYAALGIIHTRWQHLPPEFDDYIAVPKDNGYRSIHTAVVDESGAVLEVQIRTHEMHREAELGVCAHWAYKVPGGSVAEEPHAQKLNWLRQRIEWNDPNTWNQGLADLVDEQADSGRVYVTTPDGHVLDLRAGATPIDFAYRIHTEIGNRCFAARVDGRRVPLNQPLQTGQRVEIETARSVTPRLAWLDHQLGFIKTARARDNVQDWLRGRPTALIVDGAERELEALRVALGLGRVGGEQVRRLCAELGYQDREAILLALGAGELPLIEVGSLLAQTRLEQRSGQSQQTFTVEVLGSDREGLLRDVALALSQRHLSIVSTDAQLLDGGEARIRLRISSDAVEELVAVLVLLPEVPGVRTARCIDD